ncbi:MAG: carbohydrate ABC transporter permease [Eubacteriales bacterium]|nr:carbohydrate ABC transporter permease [Eubacteriales bacterium]MDD4421506.1 carbohydrate ABC transporter permease [Eubacteriales bacterium]
MDKTVSNRKAEKELLKQRKREEAIRLIRTQEKTPFWMRMKYKYLTAYYAKQAIFKIFRLLLLIGISFVILFPYYSKIAGSFMSRDDFVDVSVKLIAKYPTLDTYKAIINDNKYFLALFNTTLLSLLCGVSQMLTCAVVGYGFAKFKFKFKGLLFMLVILTMIIPRDTLQLSLFMKMRYFDIWGIVGFIKKYIFGSSEATPAIANLLNSFWPLAILSLTGLAFKNGLFIYIMRQYFNGVPDELEEAAYVDGAGVLKTFVRIILPMSVPMLVTIFMFSFSWQWSDSFYTGLFFTNKTDFVLLPDIVSIPVSLDTNYAAKEAYEAAIRNTCGLMILAPLVVLYLFGQRTLIEGVERSGITG